MIHSSQIPPIMQVQIASENDQYVKGEVFTEAPMTGLSQQQLYQYPQNQPQFPFQQQMFPVIQIPIQQQYPQMYQPQMQQQFPQPIIQPQVYLGQSNFSNMPNVIFFSGGQGISNQSQYPSSANGVPFSAKVSCYSCKKDVQTIVEDKIGPGTWCCCLLVGLVAAPCCCLPFCISSCQDKVHYCPMCKANLGYFEYRVC